MTQILEAVGAGDAQAAEQLLPLVYDELRRLVAARMAREAPGQTLQPTALVHEAWLRLIRVEDAHFRNRAHFFAAAAEAMRRILIEQARRKSAGRHGGGLERVDLEGIDLPEQASTDLLLRVDTALEELAQEDARAAALALGVTDRTARRDWRFARAWLRN
jgi:RNA polymerase sigma factor (TIGR02999 family)